MGSIVSKQFISISMKMKNTDTTRNGDLSPSVSEEADMSPLLLEKGNCKFPVDDRKGPSSAIFALCRAFISGSMVLSPQTFK